MSSSWTDRIEGPAGFGPASGAAPVVGTTATSGHKAAQPRNNRHTGRPYVARSRTRPLIVGYASALASVAAATLVRLCLNPWLGQRASFAVFYVSVVASAWLGGLGPAFLAVFLGALSATSFFLPSQSLFHLESTSG